MQATMGVENVAVGLEDDNKKYRCDSCQKMVDFVYDMMVYPKNNNSEAARETVKLCESCRSKVLRELEPYIGRELVLQSEYVKAYNERLKVYVNLINALTGLNVELKNNDTGSIV
jgi:NAD-dependent SIR2 family protein deacetylase